MMGYSRDDCAMTCGERDDACAKYGFIDENGVQTIGDPFDEIARLRSALEKIVDMIGSEAERQANEGLAEAVDVARKALAKEGK